jgi:hypothetical protein
MKLSPFHERQLAALRDMKVRGASIGRILMIGPRIWVFFLFFAVASIALYFLDSGWGLFVMGMLFGAVLRMVSAARFTVLAWPLTEQIIDWKKVEELTTTKNA